MGSPIEEMQHLARTWGGLCLSDLYINSKSKLRWQCKNGHRFQATADSGCRGIGVGNVRRNQININPAIYLLWNSL